MRFLLDQNLSPKTTSFLKELGHDVLDTRVLGLEKASDQILLQIALEQNRILITFDLDFGHLPKLPTKDFPGLIIFRTRSFKSQIINHLLENLMRHHPPEEIRNKLFVISESQIRIRSVHS